jgi:hypothetical protein
MSRGPSKWQRVILTRSQDEEGFLLLDCLYDSLDRSPRHTEYSATFRAATLLAKQGGCTLGRVWRKNFDGRRTAFVWVCRPGMPIEGEAWTRYENSFPVNPWTDMPIPPRD